MRTDIELQFGDGTYRFFLGMAQIVAIEDKCGCGIGEVFSRVFQGRFGTPKDSIGDPTAARFKVDDLTTIIRHGLIGGGKGMVDGREIEVGELLASHLIRTYISACNDSLKKAWDTAAVIIGGCVVGFDDGQKKSPATSVKSTTGASSSRTPRRSASSHRKLVD